MTTQYSLPVPLSRQHDTRTFTSRSEDQTRWLRGHAAQQITPGGTARTYVVTASANSFEVAAYFAWCMTAEMIENLPERFTVGTGRYPQPYALLARLAVDVNHEGRGLGSSLIRDVLRRTLAVSSEIGCRGLLIDAETDDASRFYQRLFPGFAESRTRQRRLCILTKQIRSALD